MVHMYSCRDICEHSLYSGETDMSYNNVTISLNVNVTIEVGHERVIKRERTKVP